ncbi:hypothetical protein DFS33DRAFT_873920 [Desarmillaria ectypa]|nr:hypothetical protein DFS33DRAFT_873920 [Desarmillaria ectypa]
MVTNQTMEQVAQIKGREINDILVPTLNVRRSSRLHKKHQYGLTDCHKLDVSYPPNLRPDTPTPRSSSSRTTAGFTWGRARPPHPRPSSTTTSAPSLRPRLPLRRFRRAVLDAQDAMQWVADNLPFPNLIPMSSVIPRTMVIFTILAVQELYSHHLVPSYHMPDPPL